MKQTTKERARKWLETAKSSDKFLIDTVPHSKKEIEDLLGGKPVVNHKEQINIDIEEKYEDLEESHDSGDTDLD